MLFDISQILRPDLPVWPGDTRFELNRTWSLGSGSPVNVSALRLSTHSGSHADAPLHYLADGRDIANVGLEPYLGPALLLDARAAPDPIPSSWVLPRLPEDTRRLLLRTYDRIPVARWDGGFKSIAPELIDALADRGIILIGTDTPSLDPEDSKTMSAHLAVAKHGLSILEGLVFDTVPAGAYELIALPLKIAGADAAPVRAILRSQDERR